jgi:NAD(P)-dependent dehydrogenase (short-subunit alcohol dehydrogenase family)
VRRRVGRRDRRAVRHAEGEWGALDGLLHSIAFAPREALAGDFLDGMSRAAFTTAHEISSYSFAALAKGARPLLAGRNASLLTLTYLGAVRALANYNVMGLAKASLEANVRYLAATLGPEGTRVNAHFGGSDQDARGGRHRRLLEDPELRREERAAASQRDDRGSGQRRRVLLLVDVERDHRRDHVRRLRLLERRRRLRRRVARRDA